MNKDDFLLKEQQQAGFTKKPSHKEKVPWKLGRNLEHAHMEKLNKLLTDHHQHMFHFLNSNNPDRKYAGRI
ncbi:hypothetical protein [Bacillus sp. OTU530]|uniref:hypothetical protein n=1 Tax=Bacillus sp. OTU530 TaxID=3043862 RepID=UPI00313B8B54